MDKNQIKKFNELKKIKDDILSGIMPDLDTLKIANEALDELSDDMSSGVAHFIAQKYNISVNTQKNQYQFIYSKDPAKENTPENTWMWKFVLDNDGNFIKLPSEPNLFFMYRDKKYLKLEEK